MGTHRAYHERKYAFGQRILICRMRAGLTQGALAEQSGVHRRSVQNWETGESYPKAEALRRLIAIFLRHQVFAAETEREEARALWSLAAEDGPHALASFDDTWFTATLAQIRDLGSGIADQGLEIGQANYQPPNAQRAAESPTSNPATGNPRTLVDWGEAIAVPTLYGRERELATLRQWLVDDRCRVIALIGLGGMGKSSLAMTVAHRVLSQFDLVMFRSLHNEPPLAEVLNQTIGALSDQLVSIPEQVPDKITRLVQLFRERRCLLILDNFESTMQADALTGTYRSGYAEYGALLQALSMRAHQSCLLLTSREKPAELGPLEGHTAPVRTLRLSGLDDPACHMIMEAKSIVGTANDLRALSQLYGGNPLALQLVAEPIRELFGGDIAAFLLAGDAFFNGMGKLMQQQFVRSTPLERTILYWLAIERELVALRALLSNLGDSVSQRELLVALESLRRRMLIERSTDQPAFTLQPVILEYVTDQLVEVIRQEIVDGRPQLLQRHVLVQATAKDYIRRSQERLIAAPLLERLVVVGSTDAVERQLRAMLAFWRDQPLLEQGYGPGNVINLLRLLRGHLRGLDLTRLAIRHAYLQGVEMQDTRLAGATFQDSVFTEAFDAIRMVLISKDGQYWAAGSRSGEVRIWGEAGKTLQLVWQAHLADMTALALSPDGRTLASVGFDNTVKLWSVERGTLLWEGWQTSSINAVAFAPDGQLLASGGNDGCIHVWDVRNGMEVQTLADQHAIVSSLAWSPDGRLLASGYADGNIWLWNPLAAAPDAPVRRLAGHTHGVPGLAFAPDGAQLASASFDGTLKLWDTARGVCLQTVSEHSAAVLRVVWSPDGRTLASCSFDHTIWLWDVVTGVRSHAVLHGHSGVIYGLAFAPDSRTLLSGSDDGSIRLWDVVRGQPLRIIGGHVATLLDIDWSPDGAQLASGGADTLVTIWPSADATPPRMLRGHRWIVQGVAWHPAGQLLASGGYDNRIGLWNTATGVRQHELRDPEVPDTLFLGVAWSPDGRLLACGSYPHGVQVWDLPAGIRRWVGHTAPTLLRRVAWSPAGTQLAGAGGDGYVYLWDASDGQLRRRLAGHAGAVVSVAWSPDGMRLASGGGGRAGGELFLWDAHSGELMQMIAGHPGVVAAVAWSTSGDTLISGGSDGALRWWDVQSGQSVRMRQGHRGRVQALKRSPDGMRLASCGDDGAIVLWDLRSGAQLQTLRRDRPYERMEIAGLLGISDAQRMSLIALGALEQAPPLEELISAAH